MTARRTSDDGGTIFTPTRPHQVLQHAEILVLQQMSDGLTRLANASDKVADDVADIKERLVRIESAGTAQQLTTLGQTLERATQRIDALEGDRDRRTGMGDLLAFANRTAPWLVTIAMGAYAYFTKR